MHLISFNINRSNISFFADRLFDILHLLMKIIEFRENVLIYFKCTFASLYFWKENLDGILPDWKKKKILNIFGHIVTSSLVMSKRDISTILDLLISK